MKQNNNKNKHLFKQFKLYLFFNKFENNDKFDPWIAISMDINISRKFSSGNGLVKIDLSKISIGSTQKGWEILPRSSPGYHYSIWQKEISIFQSIPQNAIKIIE